MSVTIRELNADDPSEVDSVAARMGATLVEVLGAARAAEVHAPDAIRERLVWHLEPPAGRQARALVAVDDDGVLLGHGLLRDDVAPWDAGRVVGLFATTYVVPRARRRGLAAALLDAGEAWMIARGLDLAMTWTEPGNAPLAALFASRGYAARRWEDWLVLSRELPIPGPTGA